MPTSGPTGSAEEAPLGLPSTAQPPFCCLKAHVMKGDLRRTDHYRDTGLSPGELGWGRRLPG